MKTMFGIGLRDGDRADRRALDLAVGDVRPVLAAVGRLPQAAAGRAEVADLGLALHAGDRDGASTALGAEASPPQAFQDHRVGRRGSKRVGRLLCATGQSNRGGNAAERQQRRRAGSSKPSNHAEFSNEEGKWGRGKPPKETCQGTHDVAMLSAESVSRIVLTAFRCSGPPVHRSTGPPVHPPHRSVACRSTISPCWCPPS